MFKVKQNILRQFIIGFKFCLFHEQKLINSALHQTKHERVIQNLEYVSTNKYTHGKKKKKKTGNIR